jgi:hypothetical protein
LRNGSGPAGIFRCTRISPFWFKIQRDHGPGVSVDATIKLVLSRVEAHEVSSSFEWWLPRLSIPQGYVEEGASISIKALEPTR